MKKLSLVFLIGLVAGLLDLIPLIMVNAPVFNMVSVLAFWLCASFFIYKTSLVENSLLNGLAIATVLMIPMALAVAATNPTDFIPMMSMALLLGPPVGWSLQKFVKA